MIHRSPHIALFLSICILMVASCQSQQKPNAPVFETTYGPVQGQITEDGQVYVTKGIPYAKPPVENLRWKAPEPPDAWTETLLCDQFGPSPMQGEPVPFSMWSQEFLIPKKPISEDCLYLNVWTPTTQEKSNLPVLVWIYGGGFVSGGSGVPIYDGEAYARDSVVFVSINYRVGIFGFFAHPELSKESPQEVSGNYGLLDQVSALKWVQDNIANFGGDADNVTIAGQSAGSMSVSCLVASPLAKGLFHRAIAESGSSIRSEMTSLDEAESYGTEVMASVQARDLADLRNIPADSLVGKGQVIRGPIVDGYFLPASVKEIYQQGKQNRVDLLTGWNQNEGLAFGPMQTANKFKENLTSQYPKEAATLLSSYPASNDSIAEQSQLAIARDQYFAYPTLSWLDFQSREKESSSYLYRFTRIVPAEGIYKKYGAFHTGEVPYAYHNLSFVNRPWEAWDHELSEYMTAYWINFIKSGNPNIDSLPMWPEYSEGEQNMMIFGEEVTSKPLSDSLAIRLIGRLGEQQK